LPGRPPIHVADVEDLELGFAAASLEKPGRGLASLSVEQDDFLTAPDADDVQQMMRLLGRQDAALSGGGQGITEKAAG